MEQSYLDQVDNAISKVVAIWGNDAISVFYLRDLKKIAEHLDTAKPVSAYRDHKKAILQYLNEAIDMRSYDLKEVYTLTNIYIEPIIKILLAKHGFESTGLWAIYIVVAAFIDLFLVVLLELYTLPYIFMVVVAACIYKLSVAFSKNKILNIHLLHLKSYRLERSK